DCQVHLVGSVRQQAGEAPQDRCAIALKRSDAVTVIETEDRRIVYQGVVFDATVDEIANAPELLDSAFGYYTYVRIEKQTGEIVIGTDRLGFSPLYYSFDGCTLHFASSISLLKQNLARVT